MFYGQPCWSCHKQICISANGSLQEHQEPPLQLKVWGQCSFLFNIYQHTGQHCFASLLIFILYYLQIIALFRHLVLFICNTRLLLMVYTAATTLRPCRLTTYLCRPATYLLTAFTLTKPAPRTGFARRRSTNTSLRPAARLATRSHCTAKWSLLYRTATDQLPRYAALQVQAKAASRGNIATRMSSSTKNLFGWDYSLYGLTNTNKSNTNNSKTNVIVKILYKA